MDGKAKPRDLEERTFRFAESVRAFVKQLPKTISNVEDIRQLGAHRDQSRLTGLKPMKH